MHASTENDTRSMVVIIPTTAFGELLRGTLESLRLQTFGDFDTLVVADGAEGDVPEWLEDDFPGTRVHRLERRQGFGAAVNAGIRLTGHPLVFLLNDDARPAPDALFHLFDAQERETSFAAFATRVVYHYSPSVLESAGDSFSCAGRGFHRGWRCKDGPPFDREEEVFGACAAAALYRREMFDRVGLFEECFFAIHEDVDLAFRARRHGFRFLYVPSARVLHKGSVTIGVKTHQAVYLDSRNSELLLIKNVPILAFLRMLPWYLLYTYHAFICAARYGRLGAYLTGKLAVLPLLGRMLRRGMLIHFEAPRPFSDVARHFDRSWHWGGLRRVFTDRRSLTLAFAAPLALVALLAWIVCT